MIQLRDKETGAAIGEITEEQLQFLIDRLVEESETDTDYYLNRATLDLLEEYGADGALIAILEKALGDREDMDIEWVRE